MLGSGNLDNRSSKFQQIFLPISISISISISIAFKSMLGSGNRSTKFATKSIFNRFSFLLFLNKSNIKKSKHILAQALAQATRARATARARDSRKELAQGLAQAKCAEHALAQAKLAQGLAQGTRARQLVQALTF